MAWHAMSRAAQIALLFCGLGTAAQAQDCRLALLLALDISSSISAEEDALQRGGLARALTSPAVAEAFFAQPDRPVALSVYEWSGRDQQAVLLDWVEISTPAALSAAAASIASSTRGYDNYPTSLGPALGFAHGRFRQAPPCARFTLDITGDGLSNDGYDPATAYANFNFTGITVNALIVGNEGDVRRYFTREVIRGPGAFIQPASDYEDFERAMARKLRRELGLMIAGAAE
ncbi:DUF1194 domain-containing protein [Abyssibius alkaniclasticus]|uniref:DUF1194 domain-containing protein n=1 Tax=Abyssibius alkaniclasticus TaxID=2881234 RepID=UPI0023648D71|nr:DUF1194 domain-containing protein [Abyssibius alkaniclasticus]UPH72171.1 DUF1194 domain-containing protein [Abyssibius alkaniclasticus]